ncbi:uncharacterized protein PEZ65_011824 isoform 2-T2 [Lycodopsis pacificus]
MEESYETFEEELRPPRADPPPQKPVRQILRPEMYAPRKVREEKSQFSQQPRAEPKILPREPSSPRTTLREASSSQNLTQIETPWENVTLNRCLFVAITILVLTSGFQRLHETLRGQGAAEEEEVGLTVRRAGKIQHRRQPPEPETSLWEVMLWWLPDLDDEEDEEDDDDDDDDDGQVKIEKSKGGATARASRGLRNKPPPDRKLMKQREGKFKERRAKKAKDEEKKEEPEAAADVEDEDEGKEEAEFEKNQKLEGKKEKKKTQKG